MPQLPIRVLLPALLALTSAAADAQVRYEVTDLGSLGGDHHQHSGDE